MTIAAAGETVLRSKQRLELGGVSCAMSDRGPTEVEVTALIALLAAIAARTAMGAAQHG
jgi:hypothetical protein